MHGQLVGILDRHAGKVAGEIDCAVQLVVQGRQQQQRVRRGQEIPVRIGQAADDPLEGGAFFAAVQIQADAVVLGCDRAGADVLAVQVDGSPGEVPGNGDVNGLLVILPEPQEGGDVGRLLRLRRGLRGGFRGGLRGRSGRFRGGRRGRRRLRGRIRSAAGCHRKAERRGQHKAQPSLPMLHFSCSCPFIRMGSGSSARTGCIIQNHRRNFNTLFR